MSQHSFSVANQSRTSYRGDVNSALQALVSQSSGASEPSTKYAYQIWADTTNGILKQRNAANAAWIIRDTLAETLVVARSSNTILGVGDYGRTFIATSSFTQTLTAAATLGDGWHCWYRNDGTGVITLDPNASETIDGGLVLTLNPGEGCRIACNGSAFKTQGLAWKITKRKTADESVTSSTTLQDDDHLTFPVGANEEWVAQFYVDAGALLTTTGLKAAITFPSGATADILMNNSGVPAVNIGTKRTATSGAGLDFTTGAHTLNDPAQLLVCVWILNGATPGNVTLQWAQSTSSGTPLKFRQGSFMQATRVA
jgi:hypothetical protein